MKKLIRISLFIILASLTACSPDEPFVTMDEDLFLMVSGEGGTVSVSFYTNISWELNGPENVIISPRTGSKGNNTVEITIPMSEDKKYETTLEFGICNLEGMIIKKFVIFQDQGPYIECDDKLMLEQNGQENNMTIHVSAQPEISTEASWLTVELEKASDEYDSYYLKAVATENPEVEERNTKVILSVGNLKKEINIIQKGGILFKYELFDASENLVKDMEGARYNYSIPPLGGSYKLIIKSNCKWTVEKSNESWSESFNYSQISRDDKLVTFSVNVAQLAKDSFDKTAILVFRLSDGSQKEIKFVQSDWRVTISVKQGQSLSNEIEKVRDKLNEGFFIDVIDINGGNIDENAPNSVRRVYISNVDKIKDNFCSNCKNLTDISLDKVREIGKEAFMGVSLRKFYIPASVRYIGDRAFFKEGSWIPVVVCYNPNPPTLGSEVFLRNEGEGYLSVPKGSVRIYERDKEWRKQFSVISEQ